MSGKQNSAVRQAQKSECLCGIPGFPGIFEPRLSLPIWQQKSPDLRRFSTSGKDLIRQGKQSGKQNEERGASHAANLWGCLFKYVLRPVERFFILNDKSIDRYHFVRSQGTPDGSEGHPEIKLKVKMKTEMKMEMKIEPEMETENKTENEFKTENKNQK